MWVFIVSSLSRWTPRSRTDFKGRITVVPVSSKLTHLLTYYRRFPSPEISILRRPQSIRCGCAAAHLLVTSRMTSRCVCVAAAHSQTRVKYMHTFNGPFSGTARVSRYQKGKTNLDFTEARDSEYGGISWAVCKSAHRSREITTPAPHHSVFYRPDALPAAQPTASKN